MEFTEKEMGLLVESMKDVREHIMNEREHCEFVRPCRLKSEMSAMIAVRNCSSVRTIRLRPRSRGSRCSTARPVR